MSCVYQPLTPSDAKPDMAMLRLIKESELRRGTIIGSGAFGTVYRVRDGCLDSFTMVV